jgi:hypothetical protein
MVGQSQKKGGVESPPHRQLVLPTATRWKRLVHHRPSALAIPLRLRRSRSPAEILLRVDLKK